jgi:hypothetical protein
MSVLANILKPRDFVRPCEARKRCKLQNLFMNWRKLIEVGVFIWMNLEKKFDSSKMKINLVYTKILVGAYNSSETRSLDRNIK